MGASGPPGGFDAHLYLSSGQYAPPVQFPLVPASAALNSHPAPPSFPPSSFPSSTSVPPKSSSFPPLPGGATMFNIAPVAQGSPSSQNPHCFARYHGSPGSVHAAGPPTLPPQADFSQGGVILSHPSSLTSTAPVVPLGQDRGLGSVPSSPLDGARLMALLTTQSAADGGGEDEAGSALSEPELPPSDGKCGAGQAPPIPNAVPTSLVAAPLSKTLQDSKLPRGRVLKGQRIVYDVDVRKLDEAQPQLEVRPITTYGSDPEFILGRQIAVNKDYVCYGLRGAAIRIINLTAELRALLRGHSNRVTDMAFAAENVNRLASVSTDGRVFVRHIMESRAADGKHLIQEHIVAAIAFSGNWTATNPRICWQKQDVLLVAVGKYVLSIDLIKVQQAAPAGGFTVDKPLVCYTKDLLGGVTLVGEHEEDVSDLAISSHSSSFIATASADGSVRVWGQNKSGYLSSFAPHMGEVVGAVAFMTAPGFPEHSILLTAGYQMNRELKLWAPEESASPSKSGNVMWECIQSIEFQSSAAGNDVDSAFYNQVAVAPQTNLIVVANAKKNAIYVLHVQFGSRPEKAQMNYLAEFSVTIPILSLTLKEQCGSEGGQGSAVQIYCVQTAAIQQYSLLVSQCLPMSTEKSVGQSFSVLDKVAVKMVTATPGPTPQPIVEKITLKSFTAATDGTYVSTSAPNVPPGYERISAVFENLLDGDQPRTEMAKLLATTNLSATEIAQTVAGDSKVPLIVASNSTQTGIERVAHLPSSASSMSETKYEAEKGAKGEQLPLIPLKILSRSTSPLKSVEQRYVLGFVGVSKNNVENAEENKQWSELNHRPGGLRRHVSATTDDSSDLIVNAPRSTGLSRQVSGPSEKAFDLRENSNAFAGSRTLQSENHQEYGIIDGPRQPRQALGTTSSFCSMNFGAQTSIEDGEQRGACNAYSTVVCSNDQVHHLITPKELMSLVDSSRPPLAGSSNSDIDNSRVVEIADAEIERVQLEAVNISNTAGGNPNILKESAATDDLHFSEFESNEQHMLGQVVGPPSPEHDTPELGQSELNATDDKGFIDPNDDDGLDHLPEVNFQLGEVGSEAGAFSHASAVTRLRKNKNKTSGGIIMSPASALLPVPSSLSSVTVAESEATNWNSGCTETGLAAQVAMMEESLNQLVYMQSELQKQMTLMVSVSVTKEGKRLEVAMGQRIEKVLKAHVDAVWARLAEENVKREKVDRERLQQITTLLSNFFNKEMPAVIERGMKKEFLALIPTISQAILPPIQKAIVTGINDSFQKGIADKLLPQLERLILGKLELSISRQLQAQFQSVGKQALQDATRISFEGFIIPTFEKSCRNMFEHVDSVFKRGMEEHVLIVQQQYTSTQTPFVTILQDTVRSASALAQSLKWELAESKKRLTALVENASLGAVVGSNRHESSGFLEKILSLQYVEETVDPTVKLAKFLKEDKLEEAFHMALSAGDVDVVSWLCNQIDPVTVFQRSPLPLGQGILLSLAQQLGYEIETDTKNKLRWIQEAVLSLNPEDPTVADHVRGILEQVLSSLQRQTNIAGPGDLLNQMRLVTHVVNSMLTACK